LHHRLGHDQHLLINIYPAIKFRVEIWWEGRGQDDTESNVALNYKRLKAGEEWNGTVMIRLKFAHFPAHLTKNSKFSFVNKRLIIRVAGLKIRFWQQSVGSITAARTTVAGQPADIVYAIFRELSSGTETIALERKANVVPGCRWVQPLGGSRCSFHVFGALSRRHRGGSGRFPATGAVSPRWNTR
ncbi:MAG: hypothetical protein ACLPJJ_05970, partial [Acidocella sp.]|uniref:hypothetical protein n=1 Tax=Acidocella sp. TaxID=50710 RepID=UPI003FD723DB